MSITETKPAILIVDDDEHIRKQMKWSLAKDYQVFLASDRLTALTLFQQESPGVMTLDLGLPPDAEGPTEGMQALEDILQLNPHVKIIVITGNTDKQNALKAIERGAYDFQQKPVNTDELKIVLHRAHTLYTLEAELNTLREQKQEQHAFEGMLGESPQMQKIFTIIERVATTDTSILITGEPGVGKELVAKALHVRSLRNKEPFIPINCAAIPETLLEDELFGHEPGAFTDARSQKIGKLERAHNGTLFLDEIGDMPLSLQPKLLRFLQDQVIERLGGKKAIQLDVRVIAATNKPLQSKDSGFREDLLFRLNEIHIDIPPLRVRGNDTLLLAKSFLHQFMVENNRPNIKGFTAATNKLIQEYPWPGNVRELRSRIKRAVVMTDGPMITPEDLDIQAGTHLHSLKEARDDAEQRVVTEALARNKGNISKAARELEVTRPTLHDLMKKYKLSRDHFR
jgi:two-component system NtrC family response regulator